jgi:hypothetical protein
MCVLGSQQLSYKLVLKKGWICVLGATAKFKLIKLRQKQVSVMGTSHGQSVKSITKDIVTCMLGNATVICGF